MILNPEIERQIRWLMTLRVVTVSTLLVSSFAVEFLLRPSESLRPLFTLTTIAFGMVLTYAVADRWLRGTQAFAVLQLVGDAVLVTYFVRITGGIDSPMSFLYLLPISVASMMLYRRGGIALAGMCWSLYASLVILGEGWLSVSPHLGFDGAREPGRVVYMLVVHFVAMIAFAILSSYLSERLQIQGRELRERQGAVVRLKALNENIIDSINSGLITTTLDGRINFINRGGEAILGHRRSDVEGQSIEDLIRLEQGFLRETRTRLLAHRRFRFEKHFDAGDGRRIFLGIAVSNLHDKAGQSLGFIFIFQDLTEIHALEQEVRLRERVVALGEMAAGMAHELRNPLAAISGAVQYLKGDLNPTGETLELMDIILRESDRLDQTIRDFLTFARPGKFTPQRTDLVKLLDDNVKLLRKSREFKIGHRVETAFPSEEVLCHADPNRLRQVFWNLATNGLKAMPDGGALRIEVREGESGRTLDVLFSDEGKGMDERQRERYFQPFNSAFDEGTGLGAAIVYRLVEEHGGRIHLQSSSGEGTCVRIELPWTVMSEMDGTPAGAELHAVGG